MFRIMLGGLVALLFASLALADRPKPSPPAPSSAQTMAELLQRARTIIKKTSALRGLRVRRSIPLTILDRDLLIKQIAQRLQQEYTEEEILAEAALLKRLRLIPESLDYKAEIFKLMKEQVAGFYDPRLKKLYLADWISFELQEPALAHEVCHALQDQHFNLKRLVTPLKDNSDQQLARAALVEGDCTGTMMEYVLAPQGLDLSALQENIKELAEKMVPGEQSPGFKDTPLFLRETMAFPYLQGLTLIQSVRAKHPWTTINRMFRRPPESTEQVLHQEKYWSREHPVRITPKALPSLAGYKLVKQDVLGEFQLSLVLAQAVSKEIASRSAAGWGGDLIQLFSGGTPGTPPLLVHLTTWDSEADALEFSNALRRLMTDRRMAPLPGASAGIWVYKEKEKLHWLLQLHEKHVLILGGVPAARVASLHQELWERWRVGGQKIKPLLWQGKPTQIQGTSTPPHGQSLCLDSRGCSLLWLTISSYSS